MGGYDTNGPQVILNQTQLLPGTPNPIYDHRHQAEVPGQLATPPWDIKPFVFQPPFDPQVHIPIILWHELGHAWGVRRGGRISDGDTWQEAVGWENLMRFTMYGSLGPENAPRKIH